MSTTAGSASSRFRDPTISVTTAFDGGAYDTPAPRRTEVLFVCTANQARSPLAAVLLERELERRSLADQVVVRSAGLHVSAGQGALPDVVRAAAAFGLQLDAHQARPVDRGQVDSADLIITFTAAHRQELNRRWRGSVHRTFTLLELDRLLVAQRAVSTDDEPQEPLRDRAHRLSGLRPWVHRPVDPEDVVDPAGDPSRMVPKVARQLDDVVQRVAAGLFG